MIKLLKKYQIQITPFAATKDWALSNSDNTDLLLFESTGSDDGLPLALEYIDYNDGTTYPYLNSSCSIALEQQSNDLATYRQGLLVTGPFYPDSDPKNTDGTYQRPIYYQIKTTFYNNYFDPSKIWGAEEIDTTISETKRNLSDRFNLLEIPKNTFGEKMIPNTINMVDNTLDNPYYITDDGNGNLLAGINIFLKQQELGDFDNIYASGSNGACDSYFSFSIPPTSVGLMTSLVNYHSASLVWHTSNVLPVTPITADTKTDGISSITVGLLTGSYQ